MEIEESRYSFHLVIRAIITIKYLLLGKTCSCDVKKNKAEKKLRLLTLTKRERKTARTCVTTILGNGFYIPI